LNYVPTANNLIFKKHCVMAKNNYSEEKMPKIMQGSSDKAQLTDSRSAFSITYGQEKIF